MKAIATLLAVIATVSAQTIQIASPAPYATLVAGQQTVVEIETPDFLSSSVEVSVAIGINPCSSNFCPPVSDTLGHLLFKGDYNPQRDLSEPLQQPFQNFTVTLPDILPKGRAVLGVAHFALIGASLGPWLETKNVSVIIG